MLDAVSAADKACHPEAVPTARQPGREAPSVETLPIGLFGCPMTLAALGLAWRQAGAVTGAPAWMSDVLMALAVLTFISLAIGYAVKLAIAPGAVRAEWRNPITFPLFGTVPINLLLLPIILASPAARLAAGLWAAGTVGAAALAWLAVSRCINGPDRVAPATPAWMLPAVALLDIPLAMPLLKLPPMHGVETFGFGVGMFLTAMAFLLIFGRLALQPPLPLALRPSVPVLVAPFASGFMAYVTMMGQTDLFPKSLYLVMGFLAAVLLPRLRRGGRCCPFRVGWWGVGFPLAMACLPALYFARTEPRLSTGVIASGVLAIATATVAALLWQTVIGVGRRVGIRPPGTASRR